MGLMLSSRHSVVFGKVRALLYATVKGMDNWPGGRRFMASQGCWKPRLLDTHKPPNQATPVTDPVCPLGTFPNTEFFLIPWISFEQ